MKKQSKKIGIGIASVLTIGVIGFMFLNGIIAFNQENLEKSIQNIPDALPKEVIEDATNMISKSPTVSLSETELKQMTVDWNYNDILRNIKDYKGKIIRIEGPIHRTETISADKFEFLVLTNPHQFPTPDKHNYIMVEHIGARFLNDDRIEVWGTVKRVSELPTLFGAEQLMPVITAIKINCLKCT